MAYKEVHYYENELTDEFSGITRNTKVVDKNYIYIHKNIFYKVFNFCTYKIMRLVAFSYLKVKFKYKIYNKNLLKGKKKYVIYGNHTHVPADGFIPNMLVDHVKPYFIVNADNVSTKGTQLFMESVGAMPIPNKIDGMRNFKNALKSRIEKHPIVIYPEAHIWPYCTMIRKFTDVSFRYPITYDVPVYCFTVTYHKHKKRETPIIKVYVDGPFLYDKTISRKEAQKKLRDEVYNSMEARSKLNTYEYVHYEEKKV